MSFLIKCGYSNFNKQIINVCLQKNELWKSGIIYINNNYICKIDSSSINNLKLVNNNDNMKTKLLLLNDTIIYEDKELFIYDINLKLSDINDYSKHNIYNYIKYNCIML